MSPETKRRLWRIWYRLFPVAHPPPWRGTRENPLEMYDLEPLMKMLGRTEQRLDGEGLHDDLKQDRMDAHPRSPSP